MILLPSIRRLKGPTADIIYLTTIQRASDRSRLTSPKHGPESNQIHGLSIELSRLVVDVGLPDALDDQAVIEEDVVEEASFERAFGRWRAIESARWSAPNRTASQDNVFRSDDIMQLYAQIGAALPDLVNRGFRLFPIDKNSA